VTLWLAIVATALGCYVLKLLGLAAPAGLLDRPAVRRFATLVPIALLAALTALQVFGSGRGLVVDARAAGLAAAAVAIVLRAPFLVVLGVAVVTTAVVRALAG
jgi:branched-subunit amino acid transport protein